MDLKFTGDYAMRGRTIIFDRFNDGYNLCTLLQEEAGDIPEQIEEKLCVHSFSEFVAKFKPIVYELTSVVNGNVTFRYSIQKEDYGNWNEIELCSHEFYRAVQAVAEAKRTCSGDLSKVDYDKLYEAFDPSKIYARARSRRELVKSYTDRAIEEMAKHNPAGTKKWTERAKYACNEVRNEYMGNALKLLPIAIEDCTRILELKTSSSDTSQLSCGTSVETNALPCKIKWDENGCIVAAPVENESQPEVLTIEQQTQSSLTLTTKLWDCTVDSFDEGTVDRNTFLSVYSPANNSQLANRSVEQLIDRRTEFSELYVDAQQSFCDAVGSLVQRVASIEQFFNHAADEKGRVEAGVIISNCTIAQVMDNQNIKNALSKALKTLSNNAEQRIWFAILPAAIDDKHEWATDENIKEYDPFSNADIFDFDSFFKTKKQNGVDVVKISDINLITEILAEHNILSFFNFNPCDKTSFKNFGADDSIIKEYTEASKDIKNRDSVVLAYPNFTIIPKEKCHHDIIDNVKLYTPPIYINAAYIACGIVVATQTLSIQKKRYGISINDKMTFTHFSLEENAWHTMFNPESRINMNSDIVSYLRGKEGNAFCFRSDSTENSAYVLTARTLGGKLIYQYLTMCYLGFLQSRHLKNGSTPTDAKAFAREINNIIVNYDKSFMNQILTADDMFEFNEKDSRYEIKFAGVEEVQEIEITIVNE